jgi:hypothetical protein
VSVVLAVVAWLLLGSVAVLLFLPDRRAGEGFLGRWGIGQPTAEQVATGTRYLRQRRVLYPLCYFAVPAVVYAGARLWGPAGGLGGVRWWGLLASILTALLLAEFVAALRPARGTTRSALLSRRRWADLVPRWAVGVHIALVGLAAAQALAAIAAHARVAAAVAAAPGVGVSLPEPTTVRRLLDTSESWLILVQVALGLVGVYGVVLLAVRRRAEADPAVDAVLRTRSARVALGVGIGLAMGLVNQTNSRVAELRAATPYGAGPRSAPGWLDVAAWLDGIGMVLVFVVGLAAWRIVAAPEKLSTSVTA